MLETALWEAVLAMWWSHEVLLEIEKWAIREFGSEIGPREVIFAVLVTHAGFFNVFGSRCRQGRATLDFRALNGSEVVK